MKNILSFLILLLLVFCSCDNVTKTNTDESRGNKPAKAIKSSPSKPDTTLVKNEKPSKASLVKKDSSIILEADGAE